MTNASPTCLLVFALLGAGCSDGDDGTDRGSGGSGSGGSSDSGGTGNSGGNGASSDGGSSSGGTGGEAGNSNGTPAGCGQEGTTGVQTRTVTVDGQSRTFVLSVPEDYAGTTAYPLVFAWHGLGGSGALARAYFGVEGEANGGALFVYPDGLPVSNQGDQPGWDLSATGVDVALFDALLAELSSEYCVDGERIFSTGHSFGGYFTNRLACSRGNVLRAVAPVAGGPAFGSGSCTEPLAAFLVHGTYDETVLLEQGVAARESYLQANGCTGETMTTAPEPCVAYQGCDVSSPVVWCEHDTVGEQAHGWPSFVAAGVWDFFSGLE